MAAVVMDTNALMMPVELDLRVFDELDRLLADPEFLVPGAVLEELRRLAEGAGEEATAARVGLDLAYERCRTINTEAADGDPAMVELASEGRVDYVVTNDRPLRERVLAEGVPTIGVRGRNTLAITEP